LNLASANYELVQSLPHVLDYIGPDPATTWAQVAAYEETLQTILLDFLNSRKDTVTIYGDPSPNKDLRVPVISFTVKGMKSQILVDEVEKRAKLGFRNGHMYAHRLLNDVCGIEDVEDGVVRISMLHYNTGWSLLTSLLPNDC
jgi:selenocysteine lyase/cysteine desulfurase